MDSASISGIVNADVDSGAAIVDTKLDTIATPGKVDAASFVDEGDWTAGFVCGTSGTITIGNSYKTGHYVKIGKMVTVTGYFQANSVSSPVGDLFLTGLPFTCGNDNKFYSAVSVWAYNLVETAITNVVGRIVNNTTQINIEKFAAGTTSAIAGDVKAGSGFAISATYFTD